MTLAARRAPSCTILRPVSIHLRWAWNAAAAAAPVFPHAAPGLILRESERERVVGGAAAAVATDGPAAAPVRHGSREYFTTRLHTAVRSQQVYRAIRREHAALRRIELMQVVRTSRRELVVEPARQLAPRLREVYTRRDQMPPAPARRLRTAAPAQPKAVPATASVPEIRAVERVQPPATAQAAPPNVDWITSQVIEQIDRRLVAYRERMGRV
jgi:hypothetical protein